MRATLTHVLTEEAYGRMIPLAERFTDGVQTAIGAHGLHWYITRLGCRAEYGFQRDRPRTPAARRPPRWITSSTASCTSTRSTAACS